MIEKKKVLAQKVLAHMRLMWKGIKGGWYQGTNATNLFDDFGNLYTELTGKALDHTRKDI